MNLKDMFGRIHTNSDHRHSDGSTWLPCFIFTAWHIRCRKGAVHPNRASGEAADLWIPAFAGMTNKLLTLRDSLSVGL